MMLGSGRHMFAPDTWQHAWITCFVTQASWPNRLGFNSAIDIDKMEKPFVKRMRIHDTRVWLSRLAEYSSSFFYDTKVSTREAVTPDAGIKEKKSMLDFMKK